MTSTAHTAQPAPTRPSRLRPDRLPGAGDVPSTYPEPCAGQAPTPWGRDTCERKTVTQCDLLLRIGRERADRTAGRTEHEARQGRGGIDNLQPATQYCRRVPVSNDFIAAPLGSLLSTPDRNISAHQAVTDLGVGVTRLRGALSAVKRILDMGYHLVDLLLWHSGLPDRVLAQHGARARPDQVYDAEDTATISFGYDSGPIGTTVLSRCVAPRSETLRVVGSSGTITVDRRRLQQQTVDGAVVDLVTRMPTSASPATAQIDQFCRILRGERANTSSPESHLAHAAFIEA